MQLDRARPPWERKNSPPLRSQQGRPHSDGSLAGASVAPAPALRIEDQTTRCLGKVLGTYRVLQRPVLMILDSFTRQSNLDSQLAIRLRHAIVRPGRCASNMVIA